MSPSWYRIIKICVVFSLAAFEFLPSTWDLFVEMRFIVVWGVSVSRTTLYSNNNNLLEYSSHSHYFLNNCDYFPIKTRIYFYNMRRTNSNKGRDSFHFISTRFLYVKLGHQIRALLSFCSEQKLCCMILTSQKCL